MKKGEGEGKREGRVEGNRGKKRREGGGKEKNEPSIYSVT